MDCCPVMAGSSCVGLCCIHLAEGEEEGRDGPGMTAVVVALILAQSVLRVMMVSGSLGGMEISPPLPSPPPPLLPSCSCGGVPCRVPKQILGAGW